MRDKNSDDTGDNKIVSLKEFKEKLQENLNATDLLGASPFSDDLAQKTFAVDALISILRYSISVLGQIAETTKDPSTLKMVAESMQNIDGATTNFLKVLQSKKPG